MLFTEPTFSPYTREVWYSVSIFCGAICYTEYLLRCTRRFFFFLFFLFIFFFLCILNTDAHLGLNLI